MSHAAARSAARLGFAAGLALAACMAGGFAQAASTAWIGDDRAAVRLITRSDSAGAERAIEAGVAFRFAPGWHGYWRKPGDAGVAPVVDWTDSTGLGEAIIAWPAPHRLVVEGLQNYIYSGEVILPVTIARADAGGPVTLRAAIRYAACSEVCVPYAADLELSLPAGVASPSAEASLIVGARARVPGAPEAAGLHLLDTEIDGGVGARRLSIRVRSEGPPLVRPDLFVEGEGIGSPAAPDIILDDGGAAALLRVALPGEPEPGSSLRLTLVDGGRSATVAAPSAPRVRLADLLTVLLSALLGGLLLNLMPCVLPVLSLKLFGLAQLAGRDRRAVRFGLVATASGILVSFLLIAGALIALKLSGASIGWGIQFQQPLFLAGMATVTVLFAASLFDWIAIGLPAGLANAAGRPAQGHLREAFLTGAFATLLATPCSAPFVGTAIGFALAQGPREILLVFAGLGLGMALPYLAAALAPGVARHLPRPGAWMERLRQGLALLLLATAAWLLAVLWQVTGPIAAAATGSVLALLMLILRRRHREAVPGHRRRSRLVYGLAVAAILAAFLPTPGPAAPPVATDLWQAFDPDMIPVLVAEGRTVVVDVTAAWCLTCKVNEATTYDRAEVSERLARSAIIRMRADWSRPDPAIARYLRRFGRFGIPLDVVYGPGRPAGDALPELLTPSILLAALDRASVVTSGADTAGAGRE